MTEKIEKADAEKCVHLKIVHYPAKIGPGLKWVTGQFRAVKSVKHEAWNLPLCVKHEMDCPVYRGLAHSCVHFEVKTRCEHSFGACLDGKNRCTFCGAEED